MDISGDLKGVPDPLAILETRLDVLALQDGQIGEGKVRPSKFRIGHSGNRARLFRWQ